MLTCDTHTHLWAPDSPERPWAPGGAEYFRGTSHLPEPMSEERLLGCMDEAGVTRAVILPPPWEGYRNDLAVEAARRHPDRIAVMPRLPLDKPDACLALLDQWADEPGIKGVRLGFRGETERGWLTDGTADWYWTHAEENDIPTWVYMPNSRDKAAEIAAAYPGIRLVMDNFNTPGGTVDEDLGPIARQAVALARYPNVSVKLSGMSGCSSAAYPFSNINGYIREIVEAFYRAYGFLRAGRQGMDHGPRGV
jgi:predicted TIM-barrel fold metal-dependent hydrolase